MKKISCKLIGFDGKPTAKGTIYPIEVMQQQLKEYMSKKDKPLVTFEQKECDIKLDEVVGIIEKVNFEEGLITIDLLDKSPVTDIINTLIENNTSITATPVGTGRVLDNKVIDYQLHSITLLNYGERK